MKLRGRAPLRLGIAGGGTDLNEVFEKYGGQVLNTTIDKYVYVDVRKSDRTTVNGREPDKFTKTILDKLETKPIEIKSWNDVPYGRGLGSSSAYSVLLAKLISRLNMKRISNDELANLVYGVENSLGKCGWQDQYASINGGFNWMEFYKEDTDVKNISRLNLPSETVSKLEKSLYLVYSGITHNSGAVQMKSPVMSEYKVSKIKELAFKAKSYLIDGKPERIAEVLREGWELKRADANTIPEIDTLMDFGLKNGSLGGKVCGAGKGGYILFYVPEQNRERFENSVNKYYERLDFKFSDNGVETWVI